MSGTSFGSLVGAHFASGSLDRMIQFSRKLESYRSTLSYLDFWPGKGGVIQGNSIREILEETLVVRNFEEMSIPFGAVAADLVTMKEIHFTEGPLIPALRSSIAIPGFLAPAVEGEHQFVDGAVLNQIPVRLAKNLGADFVIAVDVRTEEKPALFATTAGVINRSVDIMLRRIREVNLAIDPPDVLIKPDMSEIGYWEYHRIQEAMEKGRQAAILAIPAIQEQIKKFSYQKARSRERGVYTGAQKDTMVESYRFEHQKPIFLEEPDAVVDGKQVEDESRGFFQLIEDSWILSGKKSTPKQKTSRKKTSKKKG